MRTPSLHGQFQPATVADSPMNGSPVMTNKVGYSVTVFRVAFDLLCLFNQWIQEVTSSLRWREAVVPKTLKLRFTSHGANPTLYLTQGETEAGRGAVPCRRSPSDTV